MEGRSSKTHLIPISPTAAPPSPDKTHSPKLLEMHTSHQTPLHLAARNGHVDVIKILLQHGMDINVQTENGSALVEAAMYGKLPRARLSACIAASGPQVLTSASRNPTGKAKVVHLLLESGIDASAKNSLGQTALDILNNIPARKAQEIRDIIEGYLNSGHISSSSSGKEVCLVSSATLFRFFFQTILANTTPVLLLFP